MTDVSRQVLERGGIVAAAGIFIGTVCQASLTDLSQCRPASDAADLSVAVSASSRFGATDDATRRSLPSQDSGVRQACASSDSRPQRPRVVEPNFLNAVEIAGGARSASN
jgi:hypothetical protein